MELTRKDHALLDLLQQDSRLSHAEMADRLGMSASACWRRVRAMEESGVITRYAAVVDPGRMGLSFEAMLHVHLARHETDDLSRFITAIERRSEVMECYATTGQCDYHIRVLCENIDAYNRFLEGFLFKLAGVNSVQTNVVLRKIKSNAPVRGAQE
ncbi:MAG: Lrp/AsnC family transcriptional regulator [Sulfitobacter sp.]